MKKTDQIAQQQAAQAQRAANQALLDTVAEQRNTALNQLAQATASLHVALAEVDRLSAELAQARKPKRAPKPAPQAATTEQ